MKYQCLMVLLVGLIVSGCKSETTGTSEAVGSTDTTEASINENIPSSSDLTMEPTIPTNASQIINAVSTYPVVSGCFSLPDILIVPNLGDATCTELLEDVSLAGTAAVRAVGDVSCFKQWVSRAIDEINNELKHPLQFIDMVTCAIKEIKTELKENAKKLDIKDTIAEVISQDGDLGFSVEKAMIKRLKDETMGLKKFKILLKLTLPESGTLDIRAGLKKDKSTGVKRGTFDIRHKTDGKKGKLLMDFHKKTDGTKTVAFKTKHKLGTDDEDALSDASRQRYIKNTDGSGKLQIERKFRTEDTKTKQRFTVSWNVDGSGCAILAFKDADKGTQTPSSSRKKECWDANGLVSTPATDVAEGDTADITAPEDLDEGGVPEEDI
jgi:hypothetical protein